MQQSRFCGTFTQQTRLPATHKQPSCTVPRVEHAKPGAARLGSLDASLTKEGIERGGASPNTQEYPVNMFTKAGYGASSELENMHRQTLYHILFFLHNIASLDFP